MCPYPSGDVIRHAREAHGWTIPEAARTMKARYGPILPTLDSLIRSWKRWEHGTSPGRFYQPLLSDLLTIGAEPASTQHPTAEIPLVFANQAAAAAEIRAATERAENVDLLAVRGLGLLALNDSLLRPVIDRADHSIRLRALLLNPDSEAARTRAAEVGESPETFIAGLRLATARIAEMPGAEVYLYDALPTWRLLGIDDTFYVSTFAETWEGHESAVYKMVPTTAGPLHRGFRRMFDEMLSRATPINRS